MREQFICVAESEVWKGKLSSIFFSRRTRFTSLDWLDSSLAKNRGELRTGEGSRKRSGDLPRTNRSAVSLSRKKLIFRSFIPN